MSYTIYMTKKDETVLRTLDVREAAKLSGLTQSMVNYLCRQKVLVPSSRARRGRGRARQYLFGDVVMLRVLAVLLNQGVSVARLKSSLRSIRKFHPEITPTSLPASHLVTDGRQVFLKKNEDSLESLDEKGQMSFAFVIDLAQIQSEVHGKTKTMRAATG